MEIKRSYRFLIAFIFLFIFISLIQDSYAKYLTDAKANTNITIARWSILVNDEDITNNGNFSNTIEPVFTGNSNAASGILAPLSEGYFDIVLDYTNVDVAFDQEISLSHALDNTITDLMITKYNINAGNNVAVNATSTTISKTVLLSEVNRIETYRIYVKWIDGDGETMDNAADTLATKNGKASIKIDISFIQKPE